MSLTAWSYPSRVAWLSHGEIAELLPDAA
jgi:hypothetical protein